MRRREFIALLGGATAASAVRPTATGAQTPPKIPRVGYISALSATNTEHTVGAFRQRLRELGYVEGQTIALEVRYAEGRNDRMPELVAGLVALKLDVLLAGGSLARPVGNTGDRTMPTAMGGPGRVGGGLMR